MKEFIEMQDLSERIAKYLNNRDLSPNTVYTIYDGPKGLTHTVGSAEYRNDDYKELLVFRTGDDVEETYEELLESVQYALGM